MRGMARLLPLLFVAGVPLASAAVAVQAERGKVDVTATAAPLAEVLDHLARQTGMKIVYEGPAPRQLVTLSLSDRSPAEAVAAILEGQGLNYALILDVTATRVDKLLVTGPSATGSSSRTVPPPPPPPRRALARPPMIVDQNPQEDADSEDEEVVATPAQEAPAAPESQPPIPGQPQARPTPPPATAPPTAPAGVPLIPNPGYSSSPFNPKPVPLVPAPAQPTPTPTPTPPPP